MREADMFIKADQNFSAAVSRITPEQWDTKVPTTPEWTVRELVNHVAHNNMSVIDADKAKTGAGDDLLGEDPAAGWATLAKQAEDVATAATDPGMATSLSAQTGDRVLHLWDLLGALGEEQVIDPELAEFAYNFMLPNAEQIASSGLFAPAIPVPDDADVVTKLLALSGRQAV